MAQRRARRPGGRRRQGTACRWDPMQTYLVGGAVRDRLLQLEVKDRDYVVVGSDPAEMLSLGFRQVGRGFPVFLHPRSGAEYALARTERKAGHGYGGFICDFSRSVTLRDDLMRRDLTINAIAEDADGHLIDPCHGVDDLHQRLLRHISPAFAEDPLRVLRVARFAARFHALGFTVASETMDLLRDMSHSGELEWLTPERVWGELHKALCTANPEVFIVILHQVGALRRVLPWIEDLFGVPAPARWHPEIDTGVHTLMTLARAAEECTDPAIRFAMLCHDLGKALTPREQWPHHRDHNRLGLQPLQDMCRRLRVPGAYADLAAMVVLYHNDIHHLYREGAAGVVGLLERLDAFRRPQRARAYALCCRCDFLGRRGFEARPYPRTDYLLAIHSLCRGVRASEFTARGLTGAALGEQIRARRIELTQEFMQQLPRSELDDSAYAQPPADAGLPVASHLARPQAAE